ncbi:MAG: M4 family metallopeptidase [Gammaproteobacteria bacterium]|nr:M4 family metallopeptidase [Gammaproteobacteria bacterium]
MDSRTGTPRQIRGIKLQEGLPSSRATAEQFLRKYRNVIGVGDPDQEYRFLGQGQDELGRTQVRFEQRHRGLRVWPSGLLVQLDGQGHVDLMAGAHRVIPRKLLDRPAVDQGRAMALARSEVTADEHAGVAAPELIVFAPRDAPYRLAWKTQVDVSVSESWVVIVDAMHGNVLRKFNRIMNANVQGSGLDLFGISRALDVWQSGASYYMVDTSKTMYNPSSTPPNPSQTIGGIIVLDAKNKPATSDPQSYPTPLSDVVSANPNSGWLADAVSAAWALAETYDYYLERHARNSIDGQGANMQALVRLGLDFDNAFWDASNQIMAFGDKRIYAGALDVVAHEMTHAVISSTADLIYQGQSGALNESLADIFGVMVETRTQGDADWKVGEDVGQVFRNMKNPGSVDCLGVPCPSSMSGYINTTQDNGGVHLNSSIVNHAFYLLAEGLPGAIGTLDAAKIFYRALTTKLFPDADFVDARLNAVAAAEELFGAGSVQANTTAAAFDAVEIFAAPPTPPPPTQPPISSPDSTAFVFYDSFYGGFFLGRRETALNDGPVGVFLSGGTVAFTRPSVTGDGALAWFVDSINDLCAINTNAGVSEVESCLGLPGLVFSVAVSPSGEQFAFVLLDAQGFPENKIEFVDLADSSNDRTIKLQAPAIDGGTINVVTADAMDFSRDGKSLIYDAFNEVTYTGGSALGLWSIYAVELSTSQIRMIVAPIQGLDTGFPALSQTSDRFLTFDAFQSGISQANAYAGDLFTGQVGLIAAIPGYSYSVPGYTGDDGAIVFSKPDAGAATGSSLYSQAVQSDRITLSGGQSLWLSDGDFGMIYRRGAYTAPIGFNVSVAKDPAATGTGLVQSVPAGIVCGDDCSESFPQDSLVTLTAVADPYSVFAAWGGSDLCSSASAACAFTVTQDVALTVNFELDTDGDGTGNVSDVDDDGDGMLDDYEIQHGLDPLNGADRDLDLDSDGLTNFEESQLGTLVNAPDSDGDGMADGYEGDNGLNPLSDQDRDLDGDADGLTNFEEFQLGTAPNDSDTDGDGVNDKVEADTGRNPRVNERAASSILEAIREFLLDQ